MNGWNRLLVTTEEVIYFFGEVSEFALFWCYDVRLGCSLALLCFIYDFLHNDGGGTRLWYQLT